MEIKIKKKNKGKFTDYCGGLVTDECIRKAKSSNNPTLRKRATFAENSRKWNRKYQEGGELEDLASVYKINPAMPLILLRYISLLNNGVKPQAAFDISHLSIIEDGRPGRYYSFGKRAGSLQGWSDNVMDSVTTGRYKNLKDTVNFNDFKNKLKLKNYNNRNTFYNIEINRGRDIHKKQVNAYNLQNGLPLISKIDQIYTRYQV